MEEKKTKFFFTNAKGEQEEIKITPEGSMWILALGHTAVAEWKKVRKQAHIESMTEFNPDDDVDANEVSNNNKKEEEK